MNGEHFDKSKIDKQADESKSSLKQKFTFNSQNDSQNEGMFEDTEIDARFLGRWNSSSRQKKCMIYPEDKFKKWWDGL